MTDIIKTPPDALDLRICSIHTPYVDRIRDRSKRFELRTYNPGIHPGDWFIIYETKPTQHICTVARSSGYWCLTPQRAWKFYRDHLGIDEQKFQEYFAGRKAAFGIEIDAIRTFEPIPYQELRKLGFSAPQGIARWAKPTIHRRIIDAIKN